MRVRTPAKPTAQQLLAQPVPAASRKRSANRPTMIALISVGVAALAALVYFDLGAPVAFHDDWVYAWAVRRFVQGHGVVVNPLSSATAIFNVPWSVALTWGHADLRALRLSELPLLVLAGVTVMLISRQLGARWFWAVVAGLSIAASPAALGITTSYMTDGIYLGLFCAAAYFLVRWLDGRGGAVWMIAFTIAACLERQSGFGVCVSAILTLALARRSARPDRRTLLVVGVLIVATAASLLTPLVTGLSTPAQGNRLANIRIDPHLDRLALAYAGVAVSLSLIPFVAAVAVARRRGSWLPSPAGLVALVLGGIVAASIAMGLRHDDLYPEPNPGNTLRLTGLGNLTVPVGIKPSVVPLRVGLAVGSLFVLAAIVCLMVRHDLWRIRRSVVPTALVILAVTQFMPSLLGVFDDRYFLTVAAVLVPIVAARVGSCDGLITRAWAVATLALGVCWYVGGQQDYEAWQAARDQAAQMTYQLAPPAIVNAGYEANAVYYDVPLLDSGEFQVPHSTSYWDPALTGPACTRYLLAFATSDDPRPGVNYSSLAPGKIIILPGPCRPVAQP